RLNGAVALGPDVPLAVDGDAQSVHHPAKEALPHRHTGGTARAADHAAGSHLVAAVKEDAAHGIPPQILDHALDAALKEQDLAVLGVLQAVHRGDLVAHGEHMAQLL